MSRWPFVTVVFATACGSSALVDTALHEDLKSLKASIKQEQKQGELDRDSVRDLADAIVRRQVASAKTPEDAARLRLLRPCMSSVAEILYERAQGSGAPAAQATLLLLEAERLAPEPLFRRYADAKSDDWRAVAARATVSHGPARRAYFEDPASRVRRAAIQAAAQARASKDLEPLLETARLDPDPLNRSLAARAAGSIGGRRAVQGLWDHWVRAPEPQRLSIIDAWSAPASYRSGGEQKLVRVMESTSGLPQVSAAAQLVRKRAPSYEVALRTLVTAMNEGSEAEKQLALRTAPLTEERTLHAVKRAAKSDNIRVRVAALARLAQHGVERSRSLKALRALAERDGAAGRQARRAVARLGDTSVSKALVQELDDRSPRTRASAGQALLELDRYAQAARVLGDDSPDVRTQMACTVLARSDKGLGVSQRD